MKPMSGMVSSLSCCRNNKTAVTNNPKNEKVGQTSIRWN